MDRFERYSGAVGRNDEGINSTGSVSELIGSARKLEDEVIDRWETAVTMLLIRLRERRSAPSYRDKTNDRKKRTPTSEVPEGMKKTDSLTSWFKQCLRNGSLDTHVCSIVLESELKMNRLAAAMEMYEAAKGKNIFPSPSTYDVLLPCLSRQLAVGKGDINKFKIVAMDILDNNLPLTEFTLGALLPSRCWSDDEKSHILKKGFAPFLRPRTELGGGTIGVIENVDEPNVPAHVFAIGLSALAKNGLYQHAKTWFDELIRAVDNYNVTSGLTQVPYESNGGLDDDLNQDIVNFSVHTGCPEYHDKVHNARQLYVQRSIVTNTATSGRVSADTHPIAPLFGMNVIETACEVYIQKMINVGGRRLRNVSKYTEQRIEHWQFGYDAIRAMAAVGVAVPQSIARSVMYDCNKSRARKQALEVYGILATQRHDREYVKAIRARGGMGGTIFGVPDASGMLEYPDTRKIIANASVTMRSPDPSVHTESIAMDIDTVYAALTVCANEKNSSKLAERVLSTALSYRHSQVGSTYKLSPFNLEKQILAAWGDTSVDIRPPMIDAYGMSREWKTALQILKGTKVFHFPPKGSRKPHALNPHEDRLALHRFIRALVKSGEWAYALGVFALTVRDARVTLPSLADHTDCQLVNTVYPLPPGFGRNIPVGAYQATMTISEYTVLLQALVMGCLSSLSQSQEKQPVTVDLQHTDVPTFDRVLQALSAMRMFQTHQFNPELDFEQRQSGHLRNAYDANYKQCRHKRIGWTTGNSEFNDVEYFYSAALDALRHSGEWREAFRLFLRMKSEGRNVPLVLYSYVQSSVCGLRPFKHAVRVHARDSSSIWWKDVEVDHPRDRQWVSSFLSCGLSLCQPLSQVESMDSCMDVGESRESVGNPSNCSNVNATDDASPVTSAEVIERLAISDKLFAQAESSGMYPLFRMFRENTTIRDNPLDQAETSGTHGLLKTLTGNVAAYDLHHMLIDEACAAVRFVIVNDERIQCEGEKETGDKDSDQTIAFCVGGEGMHIAHHVLGGVLQIMFKRLGVRVLNEGANDFIKTYVIVSLSDLRKCRERLALTGYL
eukprot:CFRG5150T1